MPSRSKDCVDLAVLSGNNKSLLRCLYFLEDCLTAGALRLLVKGVVFDSAVLLTHR